MRKLGTGVRMTKRGTNCREGGETKDRRWRTTGVEEAAGMRSRRTDFWSKKEHETGEEEGMTGG